MSRFTDDSALFGFESDAWLERLQRLERGEPLGSLGQYELLAEAGRGGQGVVYRARQPATGRTVAVKRLLSGTLASPQALRRFEREIEAASALNHPGIVAVYGVDLVDGAPLLAMEWVEGMPVTDWAAGRPRSEVLACFLAVAEAVQHAHQHGVLHRDVKPSNVLVDASGRPRLLDFGLARSFESPSSVTTSGVFVGTPAYAAPEQLEGAELDARADVYALGAILFELLTGRRLLAGEGIDAIVRAARAIVPPRPSSLVRSIPRDLDAIVLQALARERMHRYQSVDAFASDLRRFQAGQPVLAHPPSAWYLLRKLVGRNRVASGLIAVLLLTLVLSAIAHAVLTARHAARLIVERNLALAAGEAEKQARLEADRERREAQAERAKAEAVLSFLLDDVIAAADPEVLGEKPGLLEILLSAAPKVQARFGNDSAAEARVHVMLGQAFLVLGDYREAEAEFRRALEKRESDPTASPTEVGVFRSWLGRTLFHLAELDEAEALLRSAQASADESPDGQRLLAHANSGLVGLCIRAGRSEEGLPLARRAMELATNEKDRITAASNAAALLAMGGRDREAIAEWERILPDQVRLFGERSPRVATTLYCLGSCHNALSEYSQAESALRRSLDIRLGLHDPEHPEVARAMGTLASAIARGGGDLEEAETLARRALQLIAAKAGTSVEHPQKLYELSEVLDRRGKSVEAEKCLTDALALIERLPSGRSGGQWITTARYLVEIRIGQKRFDEAEALLERIGAQGTSMNRGWFLSRSAYMRDEHGDLEQALELYDQALEILRQQQPEEHRILLESLVGLARVLRKLGDTTGAQELEREAATVPR